MTPREKRGMASEEGEGFKSEQEKEQWQEEQKVNFSVLCVCKASICLGFCCSYSHTFPDEDIKWLMDTT